MCNSLNIISYLGLVYTVVRPVYLSPPKGEKALKKMKPRLLDILWANLRIIGGFAIIIICHLFSHYLFFPPIGQRL